MSDTPTDLSTDGLNALYTVMSLAFQSVFCGMVYLRKTDTLAKHSGSPPGIYTVLVPVSTCILIKRHISRTNLLLLAAIFVPSFLSSVYWTIEIAEAVMLIDTYFIHRERRNMITITDYAAIPNAIVTINFVLSDAVVVWRAWVLCRTDYARVVQLTIIFLTFTGLTVFATIGLRFTLFLSTHLTGNAYSSLMFAINFLQESTLVLSLMTNLIATGVISHMTWRHRRLIQEGLKNMERTTRAERILALLVESGVVYCAFGVLMLVAALVRLPFRTLGDVYSPIHVQISGIYPSMVIVLVGLELTINKTTVWKSISLQVDDIPSIRSLRSGSNA
ncbi:hypothetical protein NM688_g4852 [Phlebia brevispora]|uniref:Uncharacterized protein n=1 Tax=Phlebia brevispora TaxID=194682 RepID=A0ACC1T2B4_9APHY|nr:hypothetical protein NM688_g4852 [Phlebia brevispora]